MSREHYYTSSLIGLFYDVMFKVDDCLRSIMTGANMSFRMLLPGANIGPESFEPYFRIYFKCKQNKVRDLIEARIAIHHPHPRMKKLIKDECTYIVIEIFH